MKSEVVRSAASSTTTLVLEKLPVFHGIRSRSLDEPRVDGHTHEFTVFLEHANGDMAEFVEYIEFACYTGTAWSQIVKNAPYEVTKTGRGEFKVHINIHFHWGTPPFRAHVLINEVDFSNGGGGILPRGKKIKSKYVEIFFWMLRDKPKIGNFDGDDSEPADDNSPDSTTK